MSKKLLASLIALTMVSAYACGGDDDKDDKGSSCTLGEISCVDGATAIKVCNNKGEWLDTTCSDYKQDVPNGVCQSNNCVTSGTTPVGPTPTGDCTNGAYQCTGQDLYQCVNQAWSKAKTCGANQECDATLQDCKDKETPGPGPQDEVCTKESYTPSCAADGLSGSYCGNKGTVVTVTCTADKPCVNNDGFIKCDDGSSSGNLEACKMEKDADCTACQVVCAADNSKGYYCNTKTGKMVEKICANNDCSVDGNSLNCGSSSSGGGEACTKESYTPSCAADGLSGSYCGNKGTVVTVTCTADKPCVNNDGFIKCDDGSSSGNLEACKMEKDADCTACQVVCAADNSKGYYCNTKTGKMVEKTCANNDCSVDGNSLNCGSSSSGGGEACTKESYTPSCSEDGMSGSYCGSKGTVVTVTCTTEEPCNNNDGYISCKSTVDTRPDCTASSTEVCKGACSADGKKGYYWNKELKTQDCPDADCSVSASGYVSCGTIETCDPAEYKTVCNADKKGGKRCNSDGEVRTFTCDTGSCVVHTDGKCEKCSGGTYDTEKYPGGYYECIQFRVLNSLTALRGGFFVPEQSDISHNDFFINYRVFSRKLLLLRHQSYWF